MRKEGARTRVLQLLPEFGVGGAEAMVANLMLHLDPARFDVRAASFYGPRGTRFEAELAARGLEVRYLGKRLGFDPRLFGRIARTLGEFRPDVVHSHLAVLPYALPAYLAAPGVAAVHTLHNVVEREADGPGRVAGRLLYGWRVRPVAVAGAVADGVRRMYGREAPVITNGIDLVPLRAAAAGRAAWRQAEGLPLDAFVYVCVARLMAQKNHALLLEGFADVARQRQDAWLVLVGDGTLRGDLEARARQLGVVERVRFLGVRNDVVAALGAADAFALASDFEGNPLSVMEALAAGLPVVATAVGGVPELVADGVNGLLVPPSAPGPLGAALARVAAEPGLALRLGAAAARTAEAFGVDAMTSAYESLYLSAVKA